MNLVREYGLLVEIIHNIKRYGAGGVALTPYFDQTVSVGGADITRMVITSRKDGYRVVLETDTPVDRAEPDIIVRGPMEVGEVCQFIWDYVKEMHIRRIEYGH